MTSDQYKKAFADLKDQGMKKLVVDLRDENPGGLLTAVCGVLPDPSGRTDRLYRGQKRETGKRNLERKE